MSRLSPVERDADFTDMEPLIRDQADMADAVNSVVLDLFGKVPAGGVYRVQDDDANRLLFLAGLAVDMARKVQDAYRIAHANYVAGKGGEA